MQSPAASVESAGGIYVLSLETSGYSETGLWDRLEALATVSADLAGSQDLARAAEQALQLALELTGASVAFVGLIDEAGGRQQVFSRAADPGRSVSAGEIDSLFAAAGINTSTDSGLGAYCGLPLTAGGKVIGMIGVAGGNVYSVIQRRALGILANQVAAALEIFAQSALRIERAHELAVQALLAVSTHARTGASFSAFYRGLTESVAELVGAGKVLFWHLNENRTLTPIPDAHGIDDQFIARLDPAPAEPSGSDLTSQIVYEDFVFRATKSDGDSPYRAVLEVLGVTSAISVPWRAGHQRLGMVAAYDSPSASEHVHRRGQGPATLCPRAAR